MVDALMVNPENFSRSNKLQRIMRHLSFNHIIVDLLFFLGYQFKCSTNNGFTTNLNAFFCKTTISKCQQNYYFFVVKARLLVFTKQNESTVLTIEDT